MEMFHLFQKDQIVEELLDCIRIGGRLQWCEVICLPVAFSSSVYKDVEREPDVRGHLSSDLSYDYQL